MSPGLVSLVQQDPESHLCTLTVEDEVAFGPENLALPEEDVRRWVRAAIGAVGIDHLRGRSTNELSGGEKQLVAIASVLAMDPLVLVMDEPTANLDPRGRRDVLDLAVDLVRRGDRALVVSEHRLDRLVGGANETLVLDGGSTAWRGTTSELVDEAEGLARLGVRIPDRPDLLGLGREEMTVGDPVLRASGLVAGYGEREVLEGVDLEVGAGEVVALVGPNGGGKTTLLRTVLGLADIWDGNVEVAGMDAKAERTSTLATRVGMVFQTPDHQLFERTVLRELEFGPRNMGLLDRELEHRISDLSGEYGLAAHMDVHPHRLSLGQKRRLNVASVQVTTPRLLMLDEPFIGQDLRSIQALNDRLQAASKGGTAVLLVTHDLEVLTAIADRALVLSGGKVQELDDLGVLAEGKVPWGEVR
jgi:energy-coupling factor transport system ATP-binding protein